VAAWFEDRDRSSPIAERRCRADFDPLAGDALLRSLRPLSRNANPFAFWVQASRLAWLPWLEAARIALLPFSATPSLPKAGSDARPSQQPHAQ
jgi:hypothetical protein